MNSKIIDGKILADKIIQKAKIELKEMSELGKLAHLAVLTLDNNAASKIYVKNQIKIANECNIKYSLINIGDLTTDSQIISKIKGLNNNPEITGIMLQMPLPASFNSAHIQASISPDKDVEGITPTNLGNLLLNKPGIVPCTPAAVIEVLDFHNISVKGKNVVIVGHSEIFGKPLTLLLLNRFATATVCHIETINLEAHTKNADILISATGKAGLISGSMVKNDVIAIDVGISQVPATDASGKIILTKNNKPKMKIAGDFAFEDVLKNASLITPVPGGIGPITVSMLIKNTVMALKKRNYQ